MNAASLIDAGRKPRTLLCCDLSQHCPGFAVLEYDQRQRKVRVLALHHVKNETPKCPHGAILDRIDRELSALLGQHPADVFVRERGFTRFARETQALYKVVGVADMAAHRHGSAVFDEIAPLSVKKLVTGSGKSSKGTQQLLWRGMLVSLHMPVTMNRMPSPLGSLGCRRMVTWTKNNLLEGVALCCLLYLGRRIYN